MLEALRSRRLCLSPDLVIEDGLLLVEEGRVVDAGPWKRLARELSCPVRDLGEVTLVPAPCNAHTHMELSHCLGRTRLGEGFVPWLGSLLQNDLNHCPEEALDRAVTMLAAGGTVSVVDIGSRSPEAVFHALKRAGLHGVLCGEAFGFSPLHEGETPLPSAHVRLASATGTPVAAAGHALYSTSPERLRRARRWTMERGLFFSLHLAEFPEEAEMLQTGAGSLFSFMAGPVLPEDWRPPGMGAVAFAAREGLLGRGVLAVHCVHADAADRRILKESGTLVCLCPRSNAGIGVGRADLRAFLDAGIACCLGTDSLASCTDLDVWGELRWLLKTFSLTLAEALALTSANAARLPGLGHAGRLMPGSPALWTLLPEDIACALDAGFLSGRSGRRPAAGGT